MPHDTDEPHRAGTPPTQYRPPVAHDDSPVPTLTGSPSAVGRRIGRYVVERTIGQGGMGVVVAARHETLGEIVAIKLLHPSGAKDAVQIERFVREARATARIKSEHVVRVFDVGVDEPTGAPFIVMEFLEGRDLGQVLSNLGPLPMTMAVDCIIQVCEALAAAHVLGIIHRDLKPSNFFLTHDGDGAPLVKVLDFGISKAIPQDGSADPRLTETKAVFGSPTYMSPEQIRSSRNADERSDVWSLGVALFEMLTGRLPFCADNVAGMLASIIADAPVRVSSFVQHVPPELEEVIARCLEKEPSSRIASVTELALRLAPFASEAQARLARRIGVPRSLPPPAYAPARPLGVAAHGVSAMPTAVRRVERRGWSGVVFASLVILGLASGGAYLARSTRPNANVALSPSNADAAVATDVPAIPPESSASPPVSSVARAIDEPTSAEPVAPEPPRRKPSAARAARSTAAVGSAAPAAPATPPASPNLDSRF